MVGANVVDNRLGSRFELHLDGEVAGILDYRRGTDGVSFVDVTTDPRRAGRRPRRSEDAADEARVPGARSQPLRRR